MTSAYWSDDTATLYLGDCREVLPALDVTPDSCVADPPYGETSAAWDRWPDGWVQAVGDTLPAPASLWCFGSMRMFLRRCDDFAAWKYAQESLWVKPNGSGPGSRDRLIRVHEHAVHWYRGRWTDLHHEWERVPDPEARARRGGDTSRGASRGAPHQDPGGPRAWTDDGYRQPRSVRVLHAPSVRRGLHLTAKPVEVVAELVRECTPPGGLVLDPMCGSGTTGIAARLHSRRAVLIEADERIAETAARRLSEPSLFGGAA